MKQLLASVVLAGCVALLAVAPAAQAATGEISGEVTEAAGLKGPISNISVAVFYAGDEFFEVGTALTNGSGDYSVPDLASGSYVVRFSSRPESGENFAFQYWEDKSSFEAATPVVLAAEGEHRTGIDAKLEEGGSISGKVTDSDGNAVEGAEVSVFATASGAREAVGFVRTSSTGQYTVAGLATGSYKVEVVPSAGVNLVPQYYANEDSYSSATLVPVVVKKTSGTINVTLQVGGEISGRVTNAVTHNPMAGAFVIASGVLGGELLGSFGFAVTNANGEYTILGLASDFYSVEFFAEFEGNEYIPQADGGVAVTLGDTTSGINAALIPDAPNNTGSPVASGSTAVGQTLSCSNGSWSGVTPLKYGYQWLRDGSAIGGSTGSTYVVQAADQGHGLSCEVTATNFNGHASAKSNTLSVPAPPPPPPPIPAITLPTSKVLVTGGSARVPITCTAAPCVGTIELIQRTVVKHRRGHRTVTRTLTTVLGEGAFTLAAGHSGLFVVHLNKAGKHKLDATRHHRLTILLEVSVSGGKTVKTTALLMESAVKRK